MKSYRNPRFCWYIPFRKVLLNPSPYKIVFIFCFKYLVAYFFHHQECEFNNTSLKPITVNWITRFQLKRIIVSLLSWKFNKYPSIMLASNVHVSYSLFYFSCTYALMLNTFRFIWNKIDFRKFYSGYVE